MKLRKVTIPFRLVIRSILDWLATPQAVRVIGGSFFWLARRRSSGGTVDLSEINRVLVVRLDEIGDVVMTTPLLRELRRNLPEAWITLVVKPAVRNLVERCPCVDEVLTFDRRVTGRRPDLKRHGRALKLAWHHLWRRRFDLAILPRWDIDYYHGAFVTYFSGAPWRVGYSENVNQHKQRRNGDFGRLYTYALDDGSLTSKDETSPC